ncbi:CoA transferase [Rhodoferax aquaticus]|uniref:CoA transferase n=1 Tax=Rhodoferax aquaticus TaxID=2527691 RepID=A0A515EPH7_9BURK|nr:CoA transferase [Rhodoferax aquaticus]QDL54525.1 CoA transferase [Rhodoferax aquaticus]
MARATAPSSKLPQSLKGMRVLSLALNIPGPMALMRCRQMGARCTKLEPPAHPSAPKGTPGDPMGLYDRAAYDQMHQGVTVLNADLKTEQGQKVLHKLLAKHDALLLSFRPSALKKLGLDKKSLRGQHPHLSIVSIVGALGERAEEAGHDLTYVAENGLVQGLELPASLYADMGGSLMASEALLQTRLQQLQGKTGTWTDVALSQAAAYMATPRTWGLTRPGAALGGAHAGYKVYPCKDGRVALAALEPHFAKAIAAEVGLVNANIIAMFAPETASAIAAYFKDKSRTDLDALAANKDIPLYTMA